MASSGVGMKPLNMAATGGADSAISMTKQAPIMVISAITNASMKRKPLFIRSSNRNTSAAVIRAP